MNNSLFLIFTQFFIPPICQTWCGYNQTTIAPCNNAKQLGIDFSIHGLWPEYYNNSYPSYCNNSIVFDPTKLQPIMNDLNNYWPSYMGNNSDFWKHEYMKHATCYQVNISELSFFQRTLGMYKVNNMTQELKNRGVKYNTTYYLNVLEETFNGKFHCGYPSCVEGIYNEYNQPSNMVTQFWKCFDIELNEIKCPDWLDSGSCQKEVYFQGW